ncbi:MAG: PadR family transcriptional regulator, partial [Gemmatimonadales bacterium]
MNDDNLPILQGTLDILVLKSLTNQPLHGYAVARWIRKTTDDALQIEEGALYTALHRLEKRRWIESSWGL